MLEALGIELPSSAGFLVGVGLAGGALVALTIRLLPRKSPAEPLPTVASAPTEPDKPGQPRWPEATLSVLSFDELVTRTATSLDLERTRQDCGLNERTWTEFILPIIRNVAELVQQLPASESHHHAQPGGLWSHTCETMRYAVRLRQGVVLPAGRDAEDQSKHRHRWTAGVIIAALLHDVGKTITDLNVRLYGKTHRGSPWNALAGDMRTSQATDYAVDFPRSGERDYLAHQRDGILLMQRLVPAQTMVWVSEDPPLLNTLIQYLAGEAGGKDNPIAALVSTAEKESVRMNLLEGPRTRFTTARAVPLIERLMDALRRMLAEGGSLPLNRPGAAGYVHEGDIWFAAARLANGVREYLRIHESSIGIPGEDKNDRLFDVWQDYGACRTNPTSGRALWSGRVEFDGGSAGYDLPSMLRFPLDRLYPEKSLYPANLAGRIVAIETASATPSAPSAKAEEAKPTEAPKPAAPIELAKATVATAATAIDTPAPVMPAVPAPIPAPTPQPAAAAPATLESSESVTEVLSSPIGNVPEAASPAPTPVPKSPVPAAIPAPPPVAEQYLDAQDTATRADMADPPKVDKSRPANALQPVAPAISLPALSSKPAKTTGGPSQEALDFMAWVQKGIADGSMSYNVPGSLVHFVRHKEEGGMLLVSPLIFRRFAEARGSGTEAGLSIQRAFSGAGWHVRGPGGKNVVSYQVMRKGERGGNLLNGFLVLQPERFFNPVPQINDRLVFWNTEPALMGKDKK